MSLRPKLTKHHVFLHTIIGILGWGIYFCILYIAFSGATQIFSTIFLIVAIAFVILATTAHLWSRFHKRRHDKLGYRRSHVTEASLHYDKDWLGYTVQSDVDALKQAKLITIEVNKATVDKKTKGTPAGESKKIYKVEELS